MKWRTRVAAVAVLVAVGVVGGITAGLVIAAFTDTQSNSGSLSAATMSAGNTADLYICEPDSTPGPDCGSDDSGADEVIFETLEDVIPGDVVTWDIRMRNVGPIAFDIRNHDEGFNPVSVFLIETLDPGDDCDYAPKVKFTILGINGDTANDNVPLHGTRNSTNGGFATRREGSLPSGEQYTHVHIEPGEHEDMRVTANFGEDTPAMPNECEGNVWALTVDWVADPNLH